MNTRQRFRNNVTGFLFGKYDLESNAKQFLIKEEQYISGMELIHYDEIFIVILALISILIPFFMINVSYWFLIAVIPIVYFIYLSMELELIYLTNERILIEKRTIVEKTLRTSNLESIAIDQIAVVSYARAPFQLPSIIVGTLGIATAVFSLSSDVLISGVFTRIILTILIPQFAYIVYFGLRLNKRSIELSVIGVPQTIGIGRTKGAVVWFLDDLQMIIFERVHHTFHGKEQEVVSRLHEFPLEFSSRAQELISNTKKPLQKKILLNLDQQDRTKKSILESFPDHTKSEIDEAMRQLRQKGFIYYDRKMNKWCINRESIIEELNKS